MRVQEVSGAVCVATPPSSSSPPPIIARNLDEHRLVHGAGFLNVDIMALFGYGKDRSLLCTRCSTQAPQARARASWTVRPSSTSCGLTRTRASAPIWFARAFFLCAALRHQTLQEAFRRSGLSEKMQHVGFCKLRPYPGEDAAWKASESVCCCCSAWPR